MCIVVCAGKLRVGAGWGGRVSGLSMPAATVYHQYKHSYIYTVLYMHSYIYKCASALSPSLSAAPVSAPRDTSVAIRSALTLAS